MLFWEGAGSVVRPTDNSVPEQGIGMDTFKPRGVTERKREREKGKYKRNRLDEEPWKMGTMRMGR